MAEAQTNHRLFLRRKSRRGSATIADDNKCSAWAAELRCSKSIDRSTLRRYPYSFYSTPYRLDRRLGAAGLLDKLLSGDRRLIRDSCD
jgi:hypothetical protein